MRPRIASLLPVALALALAAGVAACGDDDSCDYIFTSVPTQADCGGGKNDPLPGSLQEEFDCGNAVYTASTQTCQLISCGVCADVDSDWDGDFDFDGDIDSD